MTLAAHQFTVTDEEGNVVPGAHIEVRSEIPGQPLAALYSDRAGASGLSNPTDTDSSGFIRFFVVGGAYQIWAYTGPSGAPTFEAPLQRYVAIGLNAEADSFSYRTQRTVTAAGGVTVDADDADIIIINKTVGAATAVTLPLAASRTKPVMIVDGKGDANTNNITISPQTGESIYAITNGTAIIDGNGGSVILTPKADGTGWF
jgi:hypothetical protein